MTIICTLILENTDFKRHLKAADKTKARNGAAIKDNTNDHLTAYASSDTTPKAIKDPKKEYVIEPLIPNSFKIIRTIRDSRRTSIADLPQNPLIANEDCKLSLTSTLQHNVARRHTNTRQLKVVRLIVHAGLNTPNNESYSLVKNQRAITDKNNMRQTICILHCPLKRHHGELISYSFCSL